MQAVSAQDVVQTYLDAFNARDLDRCVSLFDENAALEFGPSTFQGAKAINDWHRTRFAADLKVDRVDGIETDGDKVNISGVVSSKRLKTWRIGTLTVKATIQVRDSKIVDMRFNARIPTPYEALRRWKKP